jgi:hypothetical protein
MEPYNSRNRLGLIYENQSSFQFLRKILPKLMSQARANFQLVLDSFCLENGCQSLCAFQPPTVFASNDQITSQVRASHGSNKRLQFFMLMDKRSARGDDHKTAGWHDPCHDRPNCYFASFGDSGGHDPLAVKHILLLDDPPIGPDLLFSHFHVSPDISPTRPGLRGLWLSQQPSNPCCLIINVGLQRDVAGIAMKGDQQRWFTNRGVRGSTTKHRLGPIHSLTIACLVLLPQTFKFRVPIQNQIARWFQSCRLVEERAGEINPVR